MLTWLDSFIKGSKAHAEAITGLKAPAGHTDLDVFQDLNRGVLKAGPPKTAPENFGQEDYGSVSQYGLHMCLLPLVRPIEGITPLCIQLSQGLASDLLFAKAPDTDDAISLMLDRHSVYLDLPHHAVMVGDLQVRALIVIDADHDFDTSGALFVSAVLTPPGENGVTGLLVWRWGTDHHYGVFNSSPKDSDLALLHRQAEDVLTLSVLYWMSGVTASEHLPTISHERLALLSPKKQSAKQKTHSLFRVVRLNSPPDRFGRTDSERVSGPWKLGVRVRVRGHFRWQPHGPKRELRRLQWIAAHHRGPEDARELIDLNVLN